MTDTDKPTDAAKPATNELASPLPLQGVIFDLDGTLANTLPVCFAAFRATFAHFVPDRDFTDSQIASYFGPNEEGVIRSVVPQKHWSAALAVFLEAYAVAHDSCPGPFPGVEAILDLLRERNIRIAVVTGKGAESAAISLARLGLADRFSIVEAGSPEGGIKAEAIRKVLAVWNLPAESAGSIAYVGDAPSDVTAARETGLQSLAAAWAPTSDPEALAAMRPDAVFASVEEFAHWVREHSEPSAPSLLPDWLRWARRMQAIAQNGLTYARDPFDKERYEALRELSVEVLTAHANELSGALPLKPADVTALFAGETGYATPKLDVRGAVFRESADGVPELLLVQEKSDGGWTLPGGWVDIGESPSEAIEKEVREEAGLDVHAVKVIAVLDRDRHGYPPLAVHVWKVFLLCEIAASDDASTPSGDGLETEGAGFFREDGIPPLSLTRVVPRQITRLFEHRRQPNLPTDFD